MGIKKRGFVQLFIFCFFILITTVSYSTLSHASSWIDREGSEIYDGNHDRDQVLKTIIDYDSEIKEKTLSALASLLIPLIIGIADALYIVLAPAGFDISSVIYGRVGGHAFMTSDISLFSYEMVKGNIYGLMSMIIYNITRSMFFMVLLCVLFLRFAGFMYTSGSAKQRAKLKESISLFFGVVFVLFLFPYILDIVIYIRDLMLYQIMHGGTDLIRQMLGDYSNSLFNHNIITEFFGTGGDYSFVTQFRAMADSNIVNASMYLSSVLLGLYFGYSYIVVAIAMVVLVIFFPYACAAEFFAQGYLSEWIKEMIGILMIPLIDATLLYIPLMIGAFGLASDNGKISLGLGLIQVLICASIIPARGYIRNRLGIGGSQSMEMAGMGALLGAFTVTKGISKGLMNAVRNNHDMSQVADRDEEQADAYIEKSKMMDFESEEREKEGIDLLNSVSQEGQEDLFQTVDAEQLENLKTEDRATARAENLANSINDMDQKKFDLEESIKQDDTKNAAIGKQIADINQDTADLRAERAGLDLQTETDRAKAQQIDQKIAENMVDSNFLSKEQSGLRRQSGEKKQEVQKLANTLKQANQILSGMQPGGKKQNGDKTLLDGLANIDNFEMPAFRSNISMERKSELYRERAKELRRQGKKELTGTATGVVVGSGMGLAGAMFSSPSKKMFVASSLGMVGGYLGGNISKRIGADVNKNKNQGVRFTYNNGQTTDDTGDSRSQGLKIIFNGENDNRDMKQGNLRLSTNRESSNTFNQDHRANHNIERSSPSKFGEYYAPENYGIGSQDVVAADNLDSDKVKKYEMIWNQIISDPNSHMEEQTRRAMRNAATAARELNNSVDQEILYDEGERENENSIIIDQAVGEFISTISSVATNSTIMEPYGEDNIDVREFEEFISKRLGNSARMKLEVYLRAKNLLF